MRAHGDALRAQRREFERVLAHHHWAMEEVGRGEPTPLSEAELDQVAANASQGLILIDQQLAGRDDKQRTLTYAEIEASLEPDEVVIYVRLAARHRRCHHHRQRRRRDGAVGGRGRGRPQAMSY